jgi:hypothetical protein
MNGSISIEAIEAIAPLDIMLVGEGNKSSRLQNIPWLQHKMKLKDANYGMLFTFECLYWRHLEPLWRM